MRQVGLFGFPKHFCLLISPSEGAEDVEWWKGSLRDGEPAESELCSAVLLCECSRAWGLAAPASYTWEQDMGNNSLKQYGQCLSRANMLRKWSIIYFTLSADNYT